MLKQVKSFHWCPILIIAHALTTQNESYHSDIHMHNAYLPGQILKSSYLSTEIQWANYV